MNIQSANRDGNLNKELKNKKVVFEEIFNLINLFNDLPVIKIVTYFIDNNQLENHET